MRPIMWRQCQQNFQNLPKLLCTWELNNRDLESAERVTTSCTLTWNVSFCRPFRLGNDCSRWRKSRQRRTEKDERFSWKELLSYLIWVPLEKIPEFLLWMFRIVRRTLQGNKFLTFTNVSEIGRSLPNTLFAYIPAVLYSRSSRKWPPRKFEKVVLTRAVRLQDWALVSDKSFRNSLKNHKEMTLNFFKYLYNTALCKIFISESLAQCAVSSKCWFVCVRLWMVAYKSLETKEKSCWVVPN